MKLETELPFKCKRCGICCHYPSPKHPTVLKKCMYLVSNGKVTTCRIYPTHEGTRIDDDVYCSENRNMWFTKCPFQTRKA